MKELQRDDIFFDVHDKERLSSSRRKKLHLKEHPMILYFVYICTSDGNDDEKSFSFLHYAESRRIRASRRAMWCDAPRMWRLASCQLLIVRICNSAYFDGGCLINNADARPLGLCGSLEITPASDSERYESHYRYFDSDARCLNIIYKCSSKFHCETFKFSQSDIISRYFYYLTQFCANNFLLWEITSSICQRLK